MQRNSIILTLAVIMSTIGLPAHAISESYRHQLERSGCTQQTDGNGCDIHKTKTQNHAATKAQSGGSVLPVSKVAEIVDRAVAGKQLDEAVSILLGAGWKQDNNNGLIFLKDNYQATLDINQKNDKVMGVSVK